MKEYEVKVETTLVTLFSVKAKDAEEAKFQARGLAKSEAVPNAAWIVNQEIVEVSELV